MSTGLARTTDPITSHEAAESIDLIRSQQLDYTFCQQYMADFFTDKALVATYRRVVETGETTKFPPLSDSRIRTARMELATKRLIFFAGHTTGMTRRERIWTLEPSLAKEE